MMISIPFGIKLAHKISLIDSPKNKRKIHTFPVPVIGGIVIFSVLAFTYVSATPYLSQHNALIPLVFSASAVLLVVGAIDDLIDVRAKYKLFFQITIAFFILQAGMADHLMYHDIQPLYYLQFALLLFLIVGVINAFNLIDGIDGLAGGIFLIAFLWLTIYAGINLQYALCSISGIISASLIGFLFFNLSVNNKIFLGDAGTLSLSSLLICCFFLISVPTNLGRYEGSFNMFLTGFLIIISLPVLDALVVFKNRIQNGKSPFSADRTHLHHRLVEIFESHIKVSKIIIGFVLSNLILGLLLTILFSPFWVPCLLICSYAFLYFALGQFKKFQSHQDILKQIQKSKKLLQVSTSNLN